MAHAEMLAALDQYKASGRLRPYTPLAVTLDKTRDHLAMTPAERRVSSVVSASELGEAHTAAVETRVQRIMGALHARGALRVRSHVVRHACAVRQNQGSARHSLDLSARLSMRSRPDPERSRT